VSSGKRTESRAAAAPALDVIHWYFTEVPTVTAAVGVAEAEKQAAAAALGVG
jgi:hypothetical protein